MQRFDIAFVGHMCFDETVPYAGASSPPPEPHIAPGSAVLCGSMAAAHVGKNVAVVTKMAKADDHILRPMRDAGITVFHIPAEHTSYMRVVHPSEDADDRRMFLKHNAGFITIDEMPDVPCARMHLAGISDREFTLGLIRTLAGRGHNLSCDMQSFVRRVDDATQAVHFKRVQNAREIASLMRRVKLDVVEAKLTTGHADLELAARMYEGWGCSEVVITDSRGILVRGHGKTLFEPFSNASSIGRTGRGDTAFAAYLSWRIDHTVAESLRFAASLVSIKMESHGPFHATLSDVLARMALYHAHRGPQRSKG